MMEEQQQRRGAPHGVLLGVVVGIVVLVPMLVGDQGEAVTDAISELLTPVGLLLLPLLLLIAIHFLSSDRLPASLFSTAEPHSIHRLSGSPLGVALFLLLLLFLLYHRQRLFSPDLAEWGPLNRIAM
ncbi:hypothetical protein Sjap_007469 [Stephania japonica]|uniref:Uncharacterized protein n=1 Tax=Stephania japonica TaxID=461633 RepID=A0AAP0JPW6_9MAGN